MQRLQLGVQELLVLELAAAAAAVVWEGCAAVAAGSRQ
jgi:hypothetical protein